jgi:hypothetical protein
MKTSRHLRSNLRLAKRLWPDQVTKVQVESLRFLSRVYGLSIASGDLQYLDRRWYVTHAGLIRLAERRRCIGIRVHQVAEFCDVASRHWVFKATVFKSTGSKGFVGYGDADPSNVSPLVRGAEMRVAETRAVNRALRKAYGIGPCSVEELGWVSEPAESPDPRRNSVGSSNGKPLLRDRLCLLIRQYNLDPTLVKAYAADFCGTPALKDASRELVESFISHVSSSAKEDRDGLICKLNSYSLPAEVKR